MARQVLARQVFSRFGLGVAALVAAAALAGCGRKGPLELPPGAPQTQTSAAASSQERRVLPVNDDPGLIQPPTTPTPRKPLAAKLKDASDQPAPPINGPAHPPTKPFVLDPLL